MTPVFNVEVAGAPSCSGALVVSGWQAQSCFTRGPTLKTGVEKGGLCLSGLMITACPVRSTTAIFTFDGLNHHVLSTFPNSRLEVEVQTLSVPPLVLSYWRPPHLRLHMAQHLGKTPAAKMYTHVDATETRLIKAMHTHACMQPNLH